ncbi:zinc ribbon domain-containing protein [Achromobacter mucicolens]|uniref:FmdB family zinc ribbon protein n=1 Tax=Achromobacter mucicolens TaxID=1389922 RepID=UPI00244AB17B|nr:zinc ribbon domain-containing protein [Achromobacter mucicolens]MDH0093056.1 zinc ribbon domain-containing protein [Achromobacter mucicolens]
MPMYDYACADCGEFAVLRPLAQWRDPAPCPRCGALSGRIVAGAPAVSALSSATNRAHAANERSANEPRSTRAGHGMNCGCCSSGRSRGRTRTSGDGAKSFAGARPWMISH